MWLHLCLNKISMNIPLLWSLFEALKIVPAVQYSVLQQHKENNEKREIKPYHWVGVVLSKPLDKRNAYSVDCSEQLSASLFSSPIVVFDSRRLGFNPSFVSNGVVVVVWQEQEWMILHENTEEKTHTSIPGFQRDTKCNAFTPTTFILLIECSPVSVSEQRGLCSRLCITWGDVSKNSTSVWRSTLLHLWCNISGFHLYHLLLYSLPTSVSYITWTLLVRCEFRKLMRVENKLILVDSGCSV